MATMIHRRIRTTERARYEQLEELLSLQGSVLRTRRQILRDSQPSGVTDMEESSPDGGEVGFSLLELTAQTVQGIETALQRLEAGQFGKCSECRCRISDARLRALPFAALCLACQEKRDGTARAVASPTPARWMARAALTHLGLVGH